MATTTSFAVTEIAALRSLAAQNPEIVDIRAMNRRGDLVGVHGTDATMMRAFRVFRGRFETLRGTASGVGEGGLFADDINELGQAVGSLRTSDAPVADAETGLLWEAGVVRARELGVGGARAINNNGTVLMTTERVTDGQTFGESFLLTRNSKKIVLDAPVWSRSNGLCRAGGLNDRGQIAGVQNGRTLLLWRGSGGGALPQAYAGQGALADAVRVGDVHINNNGSIVGAARTRGVGNVAHFLHWKSGAARAIYTVGDGSTLLSFSTKQRVSRIALNNRDECLVEVELSKPRAEGSEEMDRSYQTYLWRGEAGAERLSLARAYAINDIGQIAGRMTLRGGREAFVLLTPVRMESGGRGGRRGGSR